MKLVNSNMSQLFTIPPSAWAEINQRAGFVLHVGRLNHMGVKIKIPWPTTQNHQALNNLVGGTELAFSISSYTTVTKPCGGPGCMEAYNVDKCWSFGTGTPTLIEECNNWATTDFRRLALLAANIVNYANKAVASFQSLLSSLQARKNNVTPDIAATAKNTIKELNNSSVALNQNMQEVLANLQRFLAVNEQFNQFFISNHFLVPLLKLPECNPATISQFDSAVEAVIGAWNAISSDLAAIDDNKINVDLAFLMSLDINAAITDWKNIAKEAQQFAQNAAGLEQYWQHN